MLKNLLITLSALGSFFIVEAQDYVVTLKNDTLKGKVMISTYDIYDRVEIKEGKEKTHLTAMQVKMVSIKDEVYHTIRTEKGYRFMKLVSQGYVSQYLARSNNGNYEMEFLVRRDGTSLEVPNISFKKIMANFLSDCLTIKRKIESDELNKRKLDQIIAEYNACIENQTQQAKSVVVPLTDDDPLLTGLNNLKAKIEADTSFGAKKDVVDLLNDMTSKIRNQQSIPNYLTEGLKDYLKDAPAYQADLESILSLLKSR